MAEELKLVLTVDKEGMVSVDELEKKFARVDVQVKKSNGVLGDMSGLLKGAFIVTGINQFLSLLGKVDGLIQSLKSGAVEAKMETSFEQSFTAADDLLKKLREVSAHTIADTDIQKFAVGMKAAGIEASRLSQILEVGYKVATATGEDVVNTTNRIAMALKSGRAMSLQQWVGIIDLVKAYKEYADKNDMAVKSMNDFEKKLAVQDKGIAMLRERFGQFKADKNAEHADQLAASYENLKGTLSKGWMEAVVGTSNLFGMLADSFERGVLDSFSRTADTLRGIGQTLTGIQPGPPLDERLMQGWLKRQQDAARGALSTISGSDFTAKLTAPWEEMGRVAEEILRHVADTAVTAYGTPMDRLAESIKEQGKELQLHEDAWKFVQEQLALTLKDSDELTSVDRMRLKLLQDRLQMLEKEGIAVGKIRRELDASTEAEVERVVAAGMKGAGQDIEQMRQAAARIADEARAALARGKEAAADARGVSISGKTFDGDKKALARLLDEYAVADGVLGEYQAALNEIERATYSENAALDAQFRAIHKTMAAREEAARVSEEDARLIEMVGALRSKEDEAQRSATHQYLTGYLQEKQALEELNLTYQVLTGTLSEYEAERYRLQGEPGGGPLGDEIRNVKLAIAAEKERQHVAEQGRDQAMQLAQGMGSVVGSFNRLAVGAQGADSATAKYLASATGGFQALQGVMTAAVNPLVGIPMILSGIVEMLFPFLDEKKKTERRGVVASLGTFTPTAQTGAGTTQFTIYMGSNNVYAEDGPAVGEKLIGHINKAKYTGAKFAPQFG